MFEFYKSKIGGFLNDTINGKYDPNAKPGAHHTVYAGKGGSAITVHTQINMDGRKVAEAVTSRQAREAAKPLGGANFDGTLHPATVLMNQAH